MGAGLSGCPGRRWAEATALTQTEIVWGYEPNGRVCVDIHTVINLH